MTNEMAVLAIASLLGLIVLLRRPEWWRSLARLLRTAPVELAVGVVVLAVAFAAIDGAVTFSIALAVGVLVVIVAGVDVIRDYVLGVVLRASGRLRLGDVVVVDGHEGVVAEIGRLNVLLDDARGRLLVPHTTVVRSVVHRRSQRVGPLPHRFEVEWREDISHAEVSRTITRTVLLHPRAAAGRDPEVEPLGPQKVAVTIFTVASAHGFEVERAVREALGNDGPPRRLSLPAPPEV